MTLQSTYQIPAEEIRREIKVINSRFVATLAPASSVDEARAFIARIRKEFSDATHNVPAYILGGGNTVTEYCSDDGEPSGTAGKPALAVLRGSGLGDVVLVITRYFGGTQLGTGGLVKAYTESAQSVVNIVPRAKWINTHTALIAFPYNLLERIRLISKKFHAEILEENFAADVTMTIRFPLENESALQKELNELSSGKIKLEIIETKMTKSPVPSL